jgi:hypothetical protein
MLRLAKAALEEITPPWSARIELSFAVTEDLSGPLNVSDGCVLTFVTLARDSISPLPASVFLKTGLLGKSSTL